MRYGLLVVLLTVSACVESLVGFESATKVHPPERVFEIHEAVSRCVGVQANPERITWYSAVGLTFDSRTVAGVWEPPHSIYLIPSAWLTLGMEDDFVGRSWSVHVIGHEIVHDLLQTGSHDHTAFERCENAGQRGN